MQLLWEQALYGHFWEFEDVFLDFLINNSMQMAVFLRFIQCIKMHLLSYQNHMGTLLIKEGSNVTATSYPLPPIPPPLHPPNPLNTLLRGQFFYADPRIFNGRFQTVDLQW